MSAIWNVGTIYSNDNPRKVYDLAQEMSNANGSPVIILERCGWLGICEEPPDDMDPSPYDAGWTDYALIEPDAWREEESR